MKPHSEPFTEQEATAFLADYLTEHYHDQTAGDAGQGHWPQEAAVKLLTKERKARELLEIENKALLAEQSKMNVWISRAENAFVDLCLWVVKGAGFEESPEHLTMTIHEKAVSVVEAYEKRAKGEV